LIYFFFPETAFRSLEEIDVIFFLAEEKPGNPWLNAVKISLNEPLWFGRRGEETGFQYSNSTWHKHMQDTSGSGSGSNSGSNEKRSKNGQASGSDSSGRRPPGSSGSDTVAPTQRPLTEKSSRSRSESPIDPHMHPYHKHSPTNTMTTTITAHGNDSRRSLRDILTRSRSSEQRATQAVREFAAADEQQRLQSMQSRPADSPEETIGVARFSPDADPTWWSSDLAPRPLRVSRPPSEEIRPYSSDSATHRAFHHPDHVDQDPYRRSSNASNERAGASISRPKTSDSTGSHLSFSYPGRLRSDGLRRTESRNETYLPDGTEDVDRPGLRNRGSDWEARGAGRAY